MVSIIVVVETVKLVIGGGAVGLPKDLVLENGTLNEKAILKKELLYQGMNGRYVERFYLSPEKSYIFKPLTNNEQLGREAWVHEQILPMFPAIFPKIIAYSESRNPDESWMILEDLGPLAHEFNLDNVLGVVKQAAWWHSLPLERLENLPPAGLKPRIEEITEEIFQRKEEVLALLPYVKTILPLLERKEFSGKLVLSHGDLHIGNFAVVDGKIVVLDWEHTHLNLPYWDLYHVLDLSHPLFPKKVSSGLREQVLRYYLEQVDVVPEVFLEEYYLFSAVFSIWMILLIHKDLKADDRKWPRAQLERQLDETVSSLHQCAEWLYNRKS